MEFSGILLLVSHSDFNFGSLIERKTLFMESTQLYPSANMGLILGPENEHDRPGVLECSVTLSTTPTDSAGSLLSLATFLRAEGAVLMR